MKMLLFWICFWLTAGAAVDFVFVRSGATQRLFFAGRRAGLAIKRLLKRHSPSASGQRELLK